jgi:hypothetical protein
MFIVTKNLQKVTAEVSEPQTLRHIVDDITPILERNQVTKEFIAEKDSGRPGHYWKRDIMLEGCMPAAAFHMAALEFDGDPDWYTDDKKFQDYMKRHPRYSYFNGG